KRSAECPDPCVSKGHAQKIKLNITICLKTSENQQQISYMHANNATICDFYSELSSNHLPKRI
ncbi:MAG: hypothetical protein RML38_01640, partial [Bacteroidia bacterium]|nr:hypothetical protein [Bacteroidia bacterium]